MTAVSVSSTSKRQKEQGARDSGIPSRNGGLCHGGRRGGKMARKSRDKARPAEMCSELVGVVAGSGNRKAGVGRSGRGAHQLPKKKPSVTVSCRPNVLRRLSPSNLEEAERNFFASNCSKAPSLRYPGSPVAASRDAEKLSKVDVEYLSMAERILHVVKERFGSASAYMSATYGTETVTAEKFKDQVLEYVAELGMWQKVEVRFASSVLAIAHVTRSAPRSPFVISIQEAPVLSGMIRPICDHEAGTHLIRMANECGQTWFNRKQSWGLRHHHETEEGLATINSLLSLRRSLLLWSPALRYYATCRAMNLGFVELFQDLQQFVEDPVRRFRLCVRVKRGLRDLALPGAVNIDQAYFRGAVDILRHFREFDVTLLYAGQIAIQDIEKVRRLVRPEMCHVPPFLSSAASVAKYHCFLESIAAENGIAPATVPIYKAPPSSSARGSVMLGRRGTGLLRSKGRKTEDSSREGVGVSPYSSGVRG